MDWTQLIVSAMQVSPVAGGVALGAWYVVAKADASTGMAAVRARIDQQEQELRQLKRAVQQLKRDVQEEMAAVAVEQADHLEAHTILRERLARLEARG
jgi:uncharacterized protein YlxW (UPF0749 family)